MIECRQPFALKVSKDLVQEKDWHNEKYNKDKDKMQPFALKVNLQKGWVVVNFLL